MTKAICSVEGCDGPHKGYGYCGKHYQRFKRLGAPVLLPATRQCLGPACEREVSAHQGFGLCKSHYKQMLLGKPLKPLRVATKDLGRPAICTYEDCDRPHKARGYCKSHNALIAKGEPLRPIQLRQVPGPCSLRDCDKPRHANGYCTTHNAAYVQRWRYYGITPGIGLKMWQDQGFACAVCRVPADLHELSIDHDHTCCPRGRRGACGKCVRGLVCTPCNTGMGQMQDDPSRLRAAADYLERARTKVPCSDTEQARGRPS